MNLFRCAALATGLLAAGCATEKPKNYTITVSPGPTGPRIAYPEARGNGRNATVVFQGKFPDAEEEALLSLIRAQGWKISGAAAVGNRLFFPVQQTTDPVPSDNPEPPAENPDGNGNPEENNQPTEPQQGS